MIKDDWPNDQASLCRKQEILDIGGVGTPLQAYTSAHGEKKKAGFLEKKINSLHSDSYAYVQFILTRVRAYIIRKRAKNEDATRPVVDRRWDTKTRKKTLKKLACLLAPNERKE